MPLGLPEVFRRLHYYLYVNSNIPRADRLGLEVIRLLLCKLHDEQSAHGEHSSKFHATSREEPAVVAKRIRDLFNETRVEFPEIFNDSERLTLNDAAIKEVVILLQDIRIGEAGRDAIAEAFQEFLGAGLRGEKGQFFTPKNVVRFCVRSLKPSSSSRLVDPACGSGGFLIESLLDASNGGPGPELIGIDLESDLVRICRAYLRLIGATSAQVFHADSLRPESWEQSIRTACPDGTFDFVFTNPPFGAKIYVSDSRLLQSFHLGHKWSRATAGSWTESNSTERQVPQILFLERCLNLLREGGRVAIVLPDGVFGNPSDRYVWEFVLERSRILGVVSLAPEAFLPSTHTKTSVLFLEKTRPPNHSYPVFMAIAEKIGHDKNGKVLYKFDNHGELIKNGRGQPVVDDDLPSIVSRFRQFLASGTLETQDKLGFVIPLAQVVDRAFIPAFYDPQIRLELDQLRATGEYDLLTIGEMVDNGLVSVRRGNEVGSKFYGKGTVPFVRTSDIVNWELKVDPVKSIPREVYQRYAPLQDVKPDDILLVTDGTFLIGRTAIVTGQDLPLVIQSHLRRLRCLRPEKLHPYVLLVALNTPIVQRQIAAGTFVQATISTIGERLFQLLIPIPRDPARTREIVQRTSRVIELKSEARRTMESLVGEEARRVTVPPARSVLGQRQAKRQLVVH